MEKMIDTWLQVPAGDSSRAACCKGETLPSQFVPSPFDGAIAGSVLTKAPKNTVLTLCGGNEGDRSDGTSVAGFENSRLYYTFCGKKVQLNDLYRDESEAEFAPAEPASFETFDGTEATVTRVYVSVKGMEKAAAYDFVAYKSLPLVQVFVALNPDNAETIFPFQIAALTFEKASVTNMLAGLPKVEIPAKDDLYIAENYISFKADDS